MDHTNIRLKILRSSFLALLAGTVFMAPPEGFSKINGSAIDRSTKEVDRSMSDEIREHQRLFPANKPVSIQWSDENMDEKKDQKEPEETETPDLKATSDDCV